MDYKDSHKCEASIGYVIGKVGFYKWSYGDFNSTIHFLVYAYRVYFGLSVILDTILEYSHSFFMKKNEVKFTIKK